jgi:putative adhesin
MHIGVARRGVPGGQLARPWLIREVRKRVVLLPLLVLAATATGCDIVTAELKHSETAEWRKTYELQSGGRVEINNVNGKIEVEPSTGNAVEVVAKKTAKGATPDAAKDALNQVEIVEASSPTSIRIETKVQRGGGWLHGNVNVNYTVKVPADADVKFATVNGGVELRGISGMIEAEATNGGVVARDVSGSIHASTTNGGVDVDIARLNDRGAKLECTNGGLRLRLPSDAKATISASITNGGIEASGLQLETQESSRRRLEARLNGGGPPIRIEGTNGGIRISAR